MLRVLVIFLLIIGLVAAEERLPSKGLFTWSWGTPGG